MANIESVLARQNLLIQQNKKEIEILLDGNDELAISVSHLKEQQSLATRVAPQKTQSVGIAKVDYKKKKSSIISDKLKPQPAIRDVQMALRNAGFYIGDIDSKAGPVTRKAIKEFQSANSLHADGIVGRKTWVKLKDYI